MRQEEGFWLLSPGMGVVIHNAVKTSPILVNK